MAAEKVRENKMRRVADRRGYRLLKSRRRDPLAIGYNGYMVVAVETKAVVLGGIPRPFSATLEAVEGFFNDAKRSAEQSRRRDEREAASSGHSHRSRRVVPTATDGDRERQRRTRWKKLSE